MNWKKGTVIESKVGDKLSGTVEKAIIYAKQRERPVWLRFNDRIVRVSSRVTGIRHLDDILEDYWEKAE